MLALLVIHPSGAHTFRSIEEESLLRWVAQDNAKVNVLFVTISTDI